LRILQVAITAAFVAGHELAKVKQKFWILEDLLQSLSYIYRLSRKWERHLESSRFLPSTHCTRNSEFGTM